MLLAFLDSHHWSGKPPTLPYSTLQSLRFGVEDFVLRVLGASQTVQAETVQAAVLPHALPKSWWGKHYRRDRVIYTVL